MRALIRGMVAFVVMAVLGSTVLLASHFSHSTEFSQLPADNDYVSEARFNGNDYYNQNYHFGKYSGYLELLEEYDRYLPTGDDLTVLQVEPGLTPDNVADEVLHIFYDDDQSSDYHSRDVAEVLTKRKTASTNFTTYNTFSPDLDSFHTAVSGDMLSWLQWTFDPPNNYPATSTDGTFLTPPDLMNVSAALGPASIQRTRRHFDWFIEENNVVACTASPGSMSNNHSVSGNAYNSIVVDKAWPRSANFTGAQWNDHGSPRYKPDIVAWSQQGASSFATPQVCSMAAVLLERANVDSHLTDAQNSEVIKTILMAGATRFSYLLSTDWDDYTSATVPNAPYPRGSYRELFGEDAVITGEWERESDTQPTSYKYGAGALNALGAYKILDAGQFGDTSLIAWSSLVSSDYSENVGWDFHDQPANSTSTSTSTSHYYFSFDEKSMFSVVMNWHRRFAPHPDGISNVQSHMADYELSLYDSDDTLVANSDNTTSNVELIEVKVDAGDYRLEVEVKSANADTGMDYALAWTTKEVLDPPNNFVIVDDTPDSTTIVKWNAGASDPDEHKFRLQVSDDDFVTLDEDVWVKDASYTIASPGLDGRSIRVFTYPDDEEVAYLYPSESVQIDDPAAESLLKLHSNASTDSTEGWKIYHVLHEGNLEVANAVVELGSIYDDSISRVVVAADHLTILTKGTNHYGPWASLYGTGDYDLVDLASGAFDDELTSWWLIETPAVVLHANAESDPRSEDIVLASTAMCTAHALDSR